MYVVYYVCVLAIEVSMLSIMYVVYYGVLAIGVSM